jgi:zinc D-Ala-D-Ala dipeptidase
MSEPKIAALPVRECGEPLVDIESSAPLRVVDGPALLRFGLVERLVVAQSLLPRDVRLLITLGHRGSGSPDSSATAGQFGPSQLSGDDPHATGGAVDVTLSGATVLTCSDAAPPKPGPEPTAEGSSLLAEALTAAGLVACPSCWWHWSYGDRRWAHATNAPHARYGPVAAPGS